MNTDIILAANPPTTIIGGQPGATTATTTTEANAPAPAQDGGFLGAFGWNWILIYIVIFGGYIWFMMRNNRKKQQKVEEMRQGLQVGDDVCTTGGLIGKIVDIDDTTFVIEFGTNKGVRIPVIKSEVVAAPSTTQP